ncbi:MAG: hypothetical protein DI539_09840 [Flavobacterium psychrophilum]|nr:MAG: hypothetical protein DI539_09840 [Flavobacterium psychrophilum]
MPHAESKRSMNLSESTFPFSQRMLNFFSRAEIATVGQLSTIPIEQFTCFRGFKDQLQKELIAFIEHEEIDILFTGYEHWKET